MVIDNEIDMTFANAIDTVNVKSRFYTAAQHRREFLYVVWSTAHHIAEGCACSVFLLGMLLSFFQLTCFLHIVASESFLRDIWKDETL